MATARKERRASAEATHAALRVGRCDLNGSEAPRLAKQLGVPVGLVWLAVDQVSIAQIDEFVRWWPQKGGV